MNVSRRAAEELKPAALAVAGLLSELGITHVVTIPDNHSAPILDALRVEEGVDLLFGTREGEAISLASGLWLGGGSPAILIQNTGLLESGDGLRGTAARMGVPLLMLVTCRGYAKSRTFGKEPHEIEVTRDVLVRPDLDSVAHMTESTLDAWGIPYLFLRDPQDLSPIREGWDMAHAEGRPVVVLLDTVFT
jgi:sulfopyruvate decarboxylase subunit alpha